MPGPSLACGLAFAWLLCAFLLYASWVAPFDHFPMYLVYMSFKTLSIQYMWKYVNSKCICIESLFISPILEINWRLDLIVNDCQQRVVLGSYSCSRSSLGGSTKPYIFISTSCKTYYQFIIFLSTWLCLL